MITKSPIVLVLLALSACSSTGDTSTQTASDPEATTVSVSDSKSKAKALPPDEGDLVCRYEKTIGSRIGRRVCRTEAQNVAAREDAQEALERYSKELDPDRVVTGN